MRNKERKTQILYYIIALIWGISATLNFIDKQYAFGGLYTSLGILYLVHAINYKNNK